MSKWNNNYSKFHSGHSAVRHSLQLESNCSSVLLPPFELPESVVADYQINFKMLWMKDGNMIENSSEVSDVKCGLMDGWIDEWMDGAFGGCMDGLMQAWMDE